MGLIGSITNKVKDAAKSVTNTVTSGAKNVTKAAKKVNNVKNDAVMGVAQLGTKAVKKTGSAVIQAAGGVKNLGVKAAKKTINTTQAVAKTTKSVVKKGIKFQTDAVKGVKELTKSVAKKGVNGVKQAASGVKQIGKVALDKTVAGAKVAGKWAWDNKVEIGLWVGTTALLAAVPLTGGASGAVAGGLMASRAALIGTRIAATGRVGAAAVKGAQAGVALLRGAKGAVAATRGGQAILKGVGAVHKARVALGTTKLGQVAVAAQKPLGWAGKAIGAAFFGDTAHKFSKGEASALRLGISTLGILPLVGSATKKIANRTAVSADVQAARIAASRAPVIQQEAAVAANEASKIAKIAPSIQAPKTAGVAADASKVAADVSINANRLRDDALVGVQALRGAKGAPAADIVNKLQTVEQQAGSGLTVAQEAVKLAPKQLSPAAAAAQARLDNARLAAANARLEILPLAQRSDKAIKVAEGAETASNAASSAGLYTGIANNTHVNIQEQRLGQGRLDLTDASLIKSLLDAGLRRTKTAPVMQ